MTDPKVYFANERTLLKWLHTSVTLGSVGTGLLGVGQSVNPAGSGAPNPLRYIGLLLLFLSIVFCIYSLRTFHARVQLLNSRRSDGFDRNNGPIALAAVLIVGLSTVYCASIVRRGWL